MNSNILFIDAEILKKKQELKQLKQLKRMEKQLEVTRNKTYMTPFDKLLYFLTDIMESMKEIVQK